MAIAVFIIITILITIYSFSPLLRPRERWLPVAEIGEEKRNLEAEKTSYLRAMKDIEFEHASDKINDQDYADLKRHYGTKAAIIMKDIECLDEQENIEPEPEKDIDTQQLRERIQGDINVLKMNMDNLKELWKGGDVSDDEYFISYDQNTEELESLFHELEKLA